MKLAGAFRLGGDINRALRSASTDWQPPSSKPTPPVLVNEICPRLRKDGTRTAHVRRKWLGRDGKISNRIVTVATVWVVGTPTGTGSDSAGHG